MPTDVSAVIKETREWFRTRLSEKEFSELDLSYITQDLVNFYELYAQPKDPILAAFHKTLGLLQAPTTGCGSIESEIQINEVWEYYGYNVIINGGNASFINSNDSTGPDQPINACFGSKPWRANIRYASSPLTCPRNSPGYNNGPARGMNR